MIYIISHINPDTDAIVSTIVTADFLKKIGKKVVACRLGNINNETSYLLNYIGQKSPVLIKNLAGKKIFLVDDNTIEHSTLGIEKAEIVGILDHHRLGGMKTAEPIFCRIA